MPVQGSRPIEVLVVEDNPGDARLVAEGLRESRLENNMHHAKDGEAALAFLRREGVHAEAPRPDIVLLDLNLPRIDGHEVLAAMRADPVLKKIPVVALTTSSAKKDIDACYAAGANAFITKPVDFDKFVDALRVFDQFWFSVVTLPGGSGE